MKDPTASQLEREEKEFYGIEDLDREQRRMESEEWKMDIERQDRRFNDNDSGKGLE